MKSELSSLIAGLIKELFEVKIEVELTRTGSHFGDYATSVPLQLAKMLDKKPREIGETITAKLRESGRFTKVEVAGEGFINLTLASGVLFTELVHQVQAAHARDQAFGESQTGHGKTAIIEFPSPNMAKPYSVGHMRPANQGWAMKRLHEATGWKVITDNHLGDYGTPFGKWVVGFIRYSSEEKLVQDGIHELARVYIEITGALNSEKESGAHDLADEVQGWLLKLENGNQQALDYSKRFNLLSLSHMHHVMQRMEIDTQYELGEAFFAPMGKVIINEMINNGTAVENADGSVVAPLDDQGIDVPILLQKSNGAALYATSDLAALRFREENWHPDRVLYHVGEEQQFHFRQVFALARVMGIKTELIHVWHGMIDQINPDGTREKMSSRRGVVLMEDVLDHAAVKAREMVKSKDANDDDFNAVVLGTIKFTDFAQDRKIGMLFDWDSMFSLTGRSGPFVQYAVVRINKILRDFNGSSAKPDSTYKWTEEKLVILQLLEYPYVIETAVRDCEAHLVAIYVYGLAKLMNRYYEHTPVATAEVPESNRQSRLYLLGIVSEVMTHALSLIGIRVPQKM